MSAFFSFSSTPKFSQRVTLDPSNVPAASVNVETFTVSGLKTGMIPIVHGPSLETGVTLISSRVTANATLELTFQNNTGSGINPASQVFEVIGL